MQYKSGNLSRRKDAFYSLSLLAYKEVCCNTQFLATINYPSSCTARSDCWDKFVNWTRKFRRVGSFINKINSTETLQFDFANLSLLSNFLMQQYKYSCWLILQYEFNHNLIKINRLNRKCLILPKKIPRVPKLL